jgi:hypothetical protein
MRCTKATAFCHIFGRVQNRSVTNVAGFKTEGGCGDSTKASVEAEGKGREGAFTTRYIRILEGKEVEWE